MRLYNTLSGQVERLRRRTGQPVTVYVCGITPYDTTHLGHAFLYVTFDVLIRALETIRGWPVRYVQNLTDVDDDMLKKAAEVDEDWRALGTRWTDRFRTDMAALNVRPPDRFPGATAFVGEIVRDVEGLLAAGLAYARAGNVYFRVDADPDFGALSRLPREAMLAVANERGNHPDDPHKDDPLDFVLWQAAQPGEPAWESPWGAGRPGWHIECSSMATAALGAPIDVHGGGADLTFPHHACETAQAEPLTDARPWVRIWLHVAMVRMGGEKMSKSLGNLVLVRELLERHDPDTIRLYLLRHHYRDSWNWDPVRFAETEAWTRTLRAALAREPGRGAPFDPATYGPRFTAALEDDLDTPTAIEAALRLADDIIEARPGSDISAAQDVLRTLAGRILGLWLRPLDEVPEDERIAWPAPESAPPDVARWSGG